MKLGNIATDIHRKDIFKLKTWEMWKKNRKEKVFVDGKNAADPLETLDRPLQAQKPILETPELHLKASKYLPNQFSLQCLFQKLSLISISTVDRGQAWISDSIAITSNAIPPHGLTKIHTISKMHDHKQAPIQSRLFSHVYKPVCLSRQAEEDYVGEEICLLRS